MGFLDRLSLEFDWMICATISLSQDVARLHTHCRFIVPGHRYRLQNFSTELTQSPYTSEPQYLFGDLGSHTKIDQHIVYICSICKLIYTYGHL